MANEAGRHWREQGIAAARARDRATAQHALGAALALDPRDEEALFWLAAVQSDPAQQIAYLERVLQINPQNERARAGLDATRAQVAQAQVAPPAASAPPAAPPAHSTQADGATAHPFAGGAGDVPPPLDASTPLPWSTGSTTAPPAAPPATAPHSYSEESTPPAAPWSYSGQSVPPAAPPEMDVPERVEELVRRGMLSAKAGRTEDAQQLLLQAVELDEHNEAAWFWLSTVVSDAGDQETALENVLTLNPAHAAAQQRLDELRARQVRQVATGGGSTMTLSGATFAAPPPLVPPAPPSSVAPPAPPPLPPAGWLGGTTEGELRRPPRPTPPAEHGPTGTVVAAGLITEGSHGPQAPADVRVGTGYEHLIGTVLGKRYRVISLFSQGSSTLLLSADTRRGNLVLLRPETDLMRVGRRGSVKSGFAEGGITYYVSSISLDGLHLRNFVGTVGTLPAQQVAEYGLQLVAATRKGGPLLPRRYWSPETVKVNDSGRIVLTVEAGSMDAEVRPGAFSPPEHSAGGTLDARSDVYLIGAILYFLATASPPPPPDRTPQPRPRFDAKGKPVRGQVEATFPLHPQLDPLLAGVLATALQPDPAARYASVEALGTALGALAEVVRGRAGGMPHTEQTPQPGGSRGHGSRVGAPDSPLSRGLGRLLGMLGVFVVAGLVFFILLQVAQGLLAGGVKGGVTPVVQLTPQGSLPLGGGMDLSKLTVTAVPVLIPAGTPGINTSPQPGDPLASPGPTGAPLPTDTPEPGLPPLPPGPSATPNPAFAYPTPGLLGRIAVVQVDTHRLEQVAIYCNVASNDKPEKPVVDLRAENFTVFNNNVEMRGFQLADLRRQPEPLSTILVLDASGSMAGEPLARAKEAITTFVAHTTPGDSFALIAFNDKATLVQNWTVSHNQFQEKLDSVTAQGDTALWDALLLAADRAGREAGRTAVVLLSDGGDNKSKGSQADALAALRRVGVPLFTVGLQSDDFDPQILRAISEDTGGTLFSTPDPPALPGLYTDLAALFAAQYKITFTVLDPPTDAPQEVRLVAALAENHVLTTRTYYRRQKK